MWGGPSQLETFDPKPDAPSEYRGPFHPVATSVPGIEPHLLYPFKTWRDKAEFDATARKLVGMFRDNFVRFESHVAPDVRAAAPEVRIAAE